MSSFQGREAALTASQVEDFGLQAILEKMNSLITPLISGPFWDISNIFQKFLIFSQSLSRQKIQLKVTLVIGSNGGSGASLDFYGELESQVPPVLAHINALRILSIGTTAGISNFHSHDETWFALLAGAKAW